MGSNPNNTPMEMQEFGQYDRIKELKAFDESKAGVKGLSDSGITSIPGIFIHPPESLSDIHRKPDCQPSMSIPVVDLAGINLPSERQTIVDQVKHAAKTWGFFQVINHGIPLPVQNDTVKAIKAFHDLPHDVKSKYYRRSTGETRGAIYGSNPDLFYSAAASWRDSLQVWKGPEAAEELPEVCREEVVEWFSCAAGVAEGVMGLLAEGLGLERGKFKELSFLDGKVFVGHCYPFCPEADRTVGITSHTDAGLLTVLMQNQVSGLQVKHGDVWVDVKPLHGGLIINVGDFLQILSNDEYKSVQHRVLANSCKEPRISVVMFFGPATWRGDGYFGPLPELLSPEKPAIYRDFTRQEFLDNYYKRAFGNKSLVEKVKI